jgi:hypothetical protein
MPNTDLCQNDFYSEAVGAGLDSNTDGAGE